MCSLQVENAVTTGKTGLACTDEQRRWNAGTVRNIEPKRLRDINFSHHRAGDEFGIRVSGAQPLPNTPQYMSHAEFLTNVDKDPTKPLFQLKNSLLGKCYRAKPVVQPCSLAHTAVDARFLRPHQTHAGSDLTCETCKSFYECYVQVSSAQAFTLESETREQSSSDLWHNARKLRITASAAKKVPSRASTNPDKFIAEHLYPSFRGNYATNYGKENEVVAGNALREQGMSITQMGITVNVTEPWLSASPDGVIDSSVLLEIKCPVPSKLHSTLLDQLDHTCSDIKLVDGVPQLQKTGSRGYYMQVQIGMFCAGLKMAKLFFWSPNDSYVHCTI